MPKRLKVIDGADQGQFFALPDAGTVLIGNNHKHCEVCLHDLYVARVHCHLEIAGDRVVVHASDTPNGTLVNGVKVREHEVRLGDVIRVGNSHLRLEVADAAAPPGAARAAPAPEAPGKLPHLPAERLGELAGHTLGHYRLGKVLGRGHCGVVFRAHDDKKNQDVALRVLSPQFPADDGEMQQFVRVLKPALALRHPNLVALHAAGKAGPYVWIDMELVEGQSLTAVLQDLRAARKINGAALLRAAVGLARALEFMHRHHLVHGNIAPQNILIPAEGEEGVKLNDLVLMKALEGSALQRATLEGKLLAELPYLSPEHSDPSAALDDLSDMYSLGVVVYALLTGRPPFEGDSPEKTLALIRAALPEKPKRLQRNLPDEFQAIVLKMLAKHPEERCPTPSALLDELERVAARPEEAL